MLSRLDIALIVKYSPPEVAPAKRSAFSKGVSMYRRILTAVACLCSLGVALAQDRGSLVGTVSDVSGLAVPQAKVQITQLQTNAQWSLLANEVGQYYSPN